MLIFPFMVMGDDSIFQQIHRMAFQHFRVTARDPYRSDPVPALSVHRLAVDPGLFRDLLLRQSAALDFLFESAHVFPPRFGFFVSWNYHLR